MANQMVNACFVQNQIIFPEPLGKGNSLILDKRQVKLFSDFMRIPFY